MDYQEANRIAEALERLVDIMAHPLQSVQCYTETTTPKRTRNEAARCGNCPYVYVAQSGQCHCFRTLFPFEAQVAADAWCGQHPDFWKAEA